AAERDKSSAAGLAEVQVAMERVKVLEREAEATRQRLLAEAEGEKAKAEMLASHNSVMQQLEYARIEADVVRAVEIARAEALGEAISGMKMNLFGDTTMAQQLLQLVTTAQSAQHIYEALPPVAQNTIRGLADRLGRSTGKASRSNGKANLSEML